MSNVAPTPCLCGCGQMFNRPKSWPLCKQATVRVRDTFREHVRQNPPADYQQAFSRFYGSHEAVSAAVAGA